jgi:hypothetical protein
MLVQGVVRVLQNRAKAGKGPLPLNELETEFTQLWQVPFDLAQAGETDTAAFLQKWPNKVELIGEGSRRMVQLSTKTAAKKTTGILPAATGKKITGRATDPSRGAPGGCEYAGYHKGYA